MMWALYIIVFCIFSCASALDIFINGPVSLLDCSTHVSEEPVDPIDPKELFDAAMDGDLSFVNAAIARLSTNGLDLNWCNNEHANYTALHIAIENYHPTIIGALLDAGADTNVQNEWNETPVWVAARQGHTGVLERMLEQGGDPNKLDNHGSSPLQVASAHGHMEAARKLIQVGSHVDYVRPGIEWTALHLAAKTNHADVALLLLQNGAVKEKQDGSGNTPADVARNLGHDSVAQLIDDY